MALLVRSKMQLADEAQRQVLVSKSYDLESVQD